MRADPACRRASAGLTLLELLITLALVALMTAVLMQAMNQVRRVEDLMTAGRLDQQALQLRTEWLRAAAEAALPMPAGSPEQYRGAGREASWTTTQLPGRPGGAVGRIALQLQYDERQDRTRLLATSDGAQSSRPESWTVLSWTGRKGRLQYLDAQGGWPAAALRFSPLPAALVVDAQDGLTPLLVLGAVVGPEAEALRRALENL